MPRVALTREPHMRSLPLAKPLAQPDCRTFPCQEECCVAGVDVWPAEREALLREGLGTEADFTGPDLDDDGDSLYRTAIGARGCVFLDAVRGCRLHYTGHKPSTCVVVPRDADEVEEMRGDGMMPCHREWRW